MAQAEPHLRPSTARSYRDHIDRYLIPSIGRITLADLTGKRLQACFSLLARQRTRNSRLIAASIVDRVQATLRSALNAAVREGLLAGNPLAQVRLDKPVRPRPVIWTDERVAAWHRDGIRPPVAVWTLRQLITFLVGVENDRLAALWWLIALRGLRRGEAAALYCDDLDAEACELTISRQLVALPGELYCGPPKSRTSCRTIALDEAGTRRLVDQAVRQTVELLRHQFMQEPRPAADPSARPAALRCHPGAGLSHRPRGHPADARPLQHRHHRRYLHQRLARDRPPGSPGHRRHDHRGRSQRPPNHGAAGRP
jgi:hypothetical protein